MPGTTVSVTPAVGRLLSAHVLLYSGMSLSKTAWPLYLDQFGAVPLLAITYTAMAATGIGGAAVTGRLIDRVGVAGVLSAGSVIYAVGLLLRLQHSSWLLAVAAGVVMGAGASALTTSLRPWMVQITDDTTRPRVVSYRTARLNIGTAAGAALLSLLLLLSPSPEIGYVVGLVLPTIFIGLIALLRPRGLERPSRSVPTGGSAVPVTKPMACAVVALGAVSGFGLSMLAPYVPIVLSRREVDVDLIGIVIGFLAVIRVLVSLAAVRLAPRRRRLSLLSVAQCVLAAACVVAAFLDTPASTVLLLTLIYAALAMSAYCEELIQSELFPARLRGRLFGYSSSGFLAGDALGGIVGALILRWTEVTGLFLAYACAATVVACAYPVFVSSMRASSPKGVVADDRG